MAEAISIVLADDHTVVRRALRMLLEEEPGFEVVAEADDADDAVRYVRGPQAGRPDPRPQHARAAQPGGDPRHAGGLAGDRGSSS